MGEFADMEIDRMCVQIVWGSDYDDDCDDSMVDGFTPRHGGQRAPRRDIECKFCKAKGFHWQQVDGKWRLFDENNVIHACIKVP